MLYKGAGKGVKYFIEPDLSKLTESKIWVKAAGKSEEIRLF